MVTVRNAFAGALLAGMATAVAWGTPASADGAYPSKPIEAVIGFKPGGFSDAMTRKLSEPLKEILGHTFVPVYKAGAGGSIAATEVATADPDGYKVVVATSLTFAFNPLNGKVSYTAKDFDYLLTMARFEAAFVSMADRPWTDLPSMLAHAKESGKPLRFGSLGPADRMQMAFVADKTGVPIIPLPVKGGANAMQQLLGGHVDFVMSGGPHQQYVESGEMIVLAAAGAQPLNATPDAPTMEKLGYPAVSYNAVIAAPKGLPQDVRNKLSAALVEAAKDQRFQELVQGRNVGIEPLGADGTTQSIDAAIVSVEEMLKAAGQ